jgi:hypothetical protein
MKKQRPPRLVEFVVYYSAPFDRKNFLIDLRRRYRRRLRVKGEGEARRLAYREAFHWFFWAWLMRMPGVGNILEYVFRVGPAA